MKLAERNRDTRYFADSDGYYGDFGGAFIPEMLHKNIEELQARYLDVIESADFQRDFTALLRDYVGRPSPLYFANRLSKEHGGRIYLKREDLNHTGAHKVNNTLGQALIAKALGKGRIIAETGAGQHGVATATACALLGLECIVYMGSVDVARQAPNVARMRYLGATVISVESGSRTLKDATNEAMRDWIAHPESTHYVIGSVVGPHPFPDMVARFQSVISEEIRAQLKEHTGSELPTYLVAAVGGGSNAIGAFYHFLPETAVKLIGIEAAGEGLKSGKSAATLALGKEGVLHGCKTVLMQTEDGQVVEAHSISAGLDYPGIGPQHAHLSKIGRVKYVSITDGQALNAAHELATLEGIIPALESSHALAYLPHLKLGPADTVVVSLSGSGSKDMETYIRYMDSYRDKERQSAHQPH